MSYSTAEITSSGAGTRSPRFRRLALRVEWLFAAMIILAVILDLRSLFSNGLLPHPFFHDVNDTLMDWYNTVYWAHNRGAYDEWSTVYPPLAFAITKIFSISRCYASNDAGSRGCDPIGIWFLLISAVANLFVNYKIFHRQDPETAIPRAIALCLGMPMLFGLERGNIVIPCFTLFALGYGRLLRSARMRWLCVAAAINLKPYLILPLIGQFSKRKWRWLEGVLIAVVAVYAVTFLLIGDGFPTDLIRNILKFDQPLSFSIHSIEYANSYSGILELINQSPYPVVSIIGSRSVEFLAAIIPPFRAGGIVVAVACIGLAVVWPNVLSANRVGALSMALLLNLNSPGGYAVVFLLFYVFQERWRSWSITLAIVVAYLLSIPFDFHIAGIMDQTADSYLTGRQVTQTTSIDVGALLKPGLLILMEYALALASLVDFVRFLGPSRALQGPRALGPRASAAETT